MAVGNKIQCPKCGSMNEANSLFCGACGAKLPAANTADNEEELSAFAKGLPGWDLVPPNEPVRRRRRV